MKILAYPLIVALASVALYFGLAVTPGVMIKPTPVSTPTSHTVESHSRVEKSHSKSHSTVKVTQYPKFCVKTGVPAGYLNLREGAGTQYSVKTVLNEGDTIMKLSDKYGNWWFVEVGNGASNKRGWINSKFVEACK